MPERIAARVKEIEFYTPDLLRVSFAPEREVAFQPGQYMSIAVEGFIRRSYSLANPPHELGELVTYVDCRPGGPGSRYFARLQEGAEVDIFVPLGRFFYLPEQARPVYFFATGTGIVPFLSMIRHELEVLKSGRQIVLFYAVSAKERLMVLDQLRAWEAQHANFTANVYLKDPDEEWQGKTGRFAEIFPELKLQDIDAYICGSNALIINVEEELVKHGVTRENIHYERFY
jgi:ferredoxin-NADP reductase